MRAVLRKRSIGAHDHDHDHELVDDVQHTFEQFGPANTMHQNYSYSFEPQAATISFLVVQQRNSTRFLPPIIKSSKTRSTTLVHASKESTPIRRHGLAELMLSILAPVARQALKRSRQNLHALSARVRQRQQLRVLRRDAHSASCATDCTSARHLSSWRTCDTHHQCEQHVRSAAPQATAESIRHCTRDDAHQWQQ